MCTPRRTHAMALLSINKLLPMPILLEVFTHVPARQLVLRCRPVCSLWRDLIDTVTLWKLKSLRDGFITKDWDEPVADWKSFYFLSILRRNLLRNPCGEEGMAAWHVDANGGDEWNVESLPGACGTDFPSPQVRNYFVTSYRLCRKSQVVNLKAKGYWEELMDEVRPDIVVTDWFAARADCGCTYSICVQLLSADNIALASFEPPPVTIPQWNDATWTEVTHTFSDYPRGVRHILFQHGGKDTQSWAGWYGPRVTNSSIVISPKVTRNPAPSMGLQGPRAASGGQEQTTSSGDGPVGAPECPLVCRLPPMRPPRRTRARALLSINELLPETVLLEVLTHVPARQLVLRCRPVCSLWRDLIDTVTLWKLKSLRDGFFTEDWDQPVADWKSFYFLCIFRRNLLRNPCAEEGMAAWHIDANGGDEWNVESLPGACGTDFPSPQVRNYFVTSYRLCRKSQVVNLKAEGYWEGLMDEYRPDIVVTDWFAARADCGCTYSIRVQLLSADYIVLASFEPPPVTIPQWNDATWTEVTHTFSDYPRGVRHILFQHGGKDTQFWAGWYGPRVTNSSIVISPKVTRNPASSTGPPRPRAASDGQEQMTTSGDGPVGAPEW
ncbi:uncharacterized protein LOC123831742 isoform X2 [Phyllostomus hastatus]|nr:uncharacterized protein LOC123831742 isoform X2 [Phyllostomus hastatus]